MLNPNVAITECVDFDSAQGPQALASATNLDSAVYLSAIGMRRFVALANITALADGLILTVQLMQATSAAGAGAKALGDAGTTTAVGAVDCLAEADAHESQLDDDGDFVFVGVRVSHTGGVARNVSSILGRVPYVKPA